MFSTPPDVKSALVAFLDEHIRLTPLHGGRVGTRLYPGSESAIRVTSLGGPPDVWPWEVIEEFQLECWGGTEKQAGDLAREALAVVYEFVGPIDGGHVSIAVPALRPVDEPDPNTGRPRAICQVRITAHPSEASS